MNGKFKIILFHFEMYRNRKVPGAARRRVIDMNTRLICEPKTKRNFVIDILILLCFIYRILMAYKYLII